MYKSGLFPKTLLSFQPPRRNPRSRGNSHSPRPRALASTLPRQHPNQQAVSYLPCCCTLDQSTVLRDRLVREQLLSTFFSRTLTVLPQLSHPSGFRLCRRDLANAVRFYNAAGPKGPQHGGPPYVFFHMIRCLLPFSRSQFLPSILFMSRQVDMNNYVRS